MLRALVKTAKSIHFGVLTAQKAILLILFIPLTLAMFFEVVTRYIIGKGVFALEDFIGYSAVWLYFIGSAVATHERTQIRAEIVSMIFKGQRAQTIIKIVVAAIAFVVAIGFIQWSYIYARWSISLGETTPVYQVPFIYFQSALLAGAILMAFYFLLELIDHIRELYRYPSPSPNREA